MFTAAKDDMNVSTRVEFVQNTTAQTSASVDLRVAQYCIFVPIFLFSVTGNTLVILTVLLLRKMKTVPMIFIANLAACDLTTTVSSIPFDLPMEELGYWPYGATLCKIIYPLATFSTNAAALTLIAISIDRYISILCPLNLKYRITRGRGLKMILAIFFISVVAVAPYAVFLSYREDGGAPSCEENWPNDYNLSKIYTVVLFVLQYGLPLIVMSVIYTMIGLKLCKNTGKAAALTTGQSKYNQPRKQRQPVQKLQHSASDAAMISLQKRKRQNEKTAKMFLFVVAIFLVFMMPHQLLWLSYDYFSHTQEFRNNETVIVLVCRAFTYANSVLNVLIYGVCNGNFRRGCLSIIKCQCSKASQRSVERKRRTESFRAANKRQLARHNSSCRSTSTVDSVTTLRENRYERCQNKVIENGIKNPLQHSNDGDVVKPLIRDLKAAEINGNFLYMKKSPQSAFIRPGAYKNTSSGEFFHESKVNDTTYWLSETEALLDRLCKELDNAGERDGLSVQRQGFLPIQEKGKYLPCPQGCEEKETVL